MKYIYQYTVYISMFVAILADASKIRLSYNHIFAFFFVTIHLPNRLNNFNNAKKASNV